MWMPPLNGLTCFTTAVIYILTYMILTVSYRHTGFSVCLSLIGEIKHTWKKYLKEGFILTV